MMSDTAVQSLPVPLKAVMLCTVGFMLALVTNLDRHHGQNEILGRSVSFRARLLAGLLAFVLVIALGAYSAGFAFYVLFAFVMLMGAYELFGSVKNSANDFAQAESVFGKISGLFGWTQSGRFAVGRNNLFFPFHVVLIFYAMLGFLTAVALFGVTNA